MIIIKTNAAAAYIDSINDIVSIAATENSDHSKYKSAELRDILSVFKSKANPKLPVSQLVDNIRQLAEKLQLVDQNSTIDVETMLSGIRNYMHQVIGERCKFIINMDDQQRYFVPDTNFFSLLLVISPVVILLNH